MGTDPTGLARRNPSRSPPGLAPSIEVHIWYEVGVGVITLRARPHLPRRAGCTSAHRGLLISPSRWQWGPPDLVPPGLRAGEATAVKMDCSSQLAVPAVWTCMMARWPAVAAALVLDRLLSFAKKKNLGEEKRRGIKRWLQLRH